MLKDKQKYGLFLGCTILSSQIFVEKALKLIGKRLNIKFIEFEESTCCPEPEISKTVSYDAWIRGASRNLALCEKVSDRLCVICSGCYHTFHKANKSLQSDPLLLKTVNTKLKTVKKVYNGSIQVRNFIEVLHDDYGIKRLKKKYKRTFKGINIAIHPGCRLLTAESFTDPQRSLTYKLENLVQSTGASVIDWEGQLLCCGTPAMYNDPEFALEQRAKPKVQAIKEGNPDTVVVICPACYDMIEKAALASLEPEELFPLVNIVELIAYTLGYSSDDIGFDHHRIPMDSLLEKIEK
jgi:heterodisulfide reductase subunit B